MSDKYKYLFDPNRPPKMLYCSKCVYPKSSAIPLAFDENGVCSGCKTTSQKIEVDWDRRKVLFQRIIDEYRSEDGTNYDCIIPVSGGKDSYYQTHIIKTVFE